MEVDNNVVNAEIIAQDNNFEVESTAAELVDSMKNSKTSANEISQILQNADLAGKYVEFGQTFLELLRDSYKVHDKYEETLSILITKTHSILMDANITEDKKKEIEDHFYQILAKLDKLQEQKRDERKEIQKTALKALAMVGAVVVAIVTAGRVNLSDKVR